MFVSLVFFFKKWAGKKGQENKIYMHKTEGKQFWYLFSIQSTKNEKCSLVKWSENQNLVSEKKDMWKFLRNIWGEKYFISCVRTSFVMCGIRRKKWRREKMWMCEREFSPGENKRVNLEKMSNDTMFSPRESGKDFSSLLVWNKVKKKIVQMCENWVDIVFLCVFVGKKNKSSKTQEWKWRVVILSYEIFSIIRF